MAARVLTEEDLEPLRREVAELRALVAARSAPVELTAEQAAEQLGVAPKTIRRWARQGRLQGRRRGREWRFPGLELAAPDGPSPEAAAEAAVAALSRPRRSC